MGGVGRSSCKNLVPCLKQSLVIYHIAASLSAFTIIAIAMYMRFDWDIKDYVRQLQAQLLWTGPMILLAGSVISLLVSMLGCYATIQEHPRLLATTVWITAAAIILEISGVAYTLDYGTLWSKITDWMKEKFFHLINYSDVDPMAARTLRIIQENLHCCGATGWLDYVDLNKVVPHECRDQTTGNMYLFGCHIIISEWLEPLTGWISGIGLFLVCLQILACVAMMIIRWATLRDPRDQGNDYKTVRTSKI